MAVIDLKNCTFKLLDGTGTPNTLTIKLADGTFKYSEDRPIEYIKDRGILSSTKLGDQMPMDVSFDFFWEFLKADTALPPSVEDVLKNVNNASTWISSDTDLCQPFSIDIQITNAPVCAGIKTEVILVSLFRYEKLDFDPKSSHVAVSGKCNKMQAVITRV